MFEDTTPLDPDEVAKRLGVSVWTVYRLMDQRRIAYSRVSPRRRIITEAQFAEYINARTVPAEPG